MRKWRGFLAVLIVLSLISGCSPRANKRTTDEEEAISAVVPPVGATGQGKLTGVLSGVGTESQSGNDESDTTYWILTLNWQQESKQSDFLLSKETQLTVDGGPVPQEDVAQKAEVLEGFLGKTISISYAESSTAPLWFGSDPPQPLRALTVVTLSAGK